MALCCIFSGPYLDFDENQFWLDGFFLFYFVFFLGDKGCGGGGEFIKCHCYIEQKMVN